MNKYIKLVIAGLMVAGGIFLMFNRQVGWGIDFYEKNNDFHFYNSTKNCIFRKS